MANPQFVNNEIYHLCNRGVDKRQIFMDDSDSFRFIHNLFEFNDQEPAIFFRGSSNTTATKEKYGVGPRTLSAIVEKEARTKPRELLVEILVWCLMPNHYHLLVRQLVDGGVSLFMKKLNGGYTCSFNIKYERSGSLFQGKFKAVRLATDAHFSHIPFYIHLNPLDLIEPSWKGQGVKDYKKAIDFLEQYRFSSHMDYIDKKNFPSVGQRDFLLNIFNGSTEYKKQCYQWLKSFSQNQNIEEMVRIIKDLALD